MKILKALVFMFGLVPVLAAAAWPAGQYTVSFYGDSSPGNGSQGICIVSGGTWYGTTFSSWSGVWFSRGNDLHMHGNYSAGTGNDAFELTKISNGLSTGYWQEWRDDGSFNNYVTAKFQFTSATCNPPASPESGVVDGNPSGSVK